MVAALEVVQQLLEGQLRPLDVPRLRPPRAQDRRRRHDDDGNRGEDDKRTEKADDDRRGGTDSSGRGGAGSKLSSPLHETGIERDDTTAGVDHGRGRRDLAGPAERVAATGEVERLGESSSQVATRFPDDSI